MPPNILVVEDDANLNRLYTRKLSQTGFGVDSVFSVQEAIRYLDGETVPLVVILDMNLPDGSGSQVLKHLNQQLYKKTRVVVVSGEAYSHQHTDEHHKPDYELLKPVSPRVLALLVNQVVNDATLSFRGINRRPRS